MSNTPTLLQPNDCGGQGVVVPSYDYDTLGAPFLVTLKDSVVVRIDPETRKEVVKIPDPMGLLRSVVRTRVLDARKLSGSELKFVRQAIDAPANKIATFLDCTPEHLSRCESGERVLSASAEKHLRLFAFCATLFSDTAQLLELGANTSQIQPRPLNKKSDRMAKTFINTFLTMKIQTFRDPDEKIEYVFYRRHVECDVPADDDWEPLAA